jgi:ABC-2 type transport system ATP-binding protein
MALAEADVTAVSNADGTLTVRGLSPDRVGDIAFEHGVRLHELTPARASLEAAFMELTADSVEYQAGIPGQPPAPPPVPPAQPVTAQQGRQA